MVWVQGCRFWGVGLRKQGFNIEIRVIRDSAPKFTQCTSVHHTQISTLVVKAVLLLLYSTLVPQYPTFKLFGFL